MNSNNISLELEMYCNAIKQYISDEGITVSQFSSSTNITNAQLSKMLNGKTKYINRNTIEKLLPFVGQYIDRMKDSDNKFHVKIMQLSITDKMYFFRLLMDKLPEHKINTLMDRAFETLDSEGQKYATQLVNYLIKRSLQKESKTKQAELVKFIYANKESAESNDI